MDEPLRVGVIGLGRRWERRYAAALRALPDLFELGAVCDQIAQRTALVAARLRCPAAAGPAELLERDDLDAVLLLDLGWQRLWPVRRACRVGKPVFCLPGLEDDPEDADALARLVHDARLPVLMAAPEAFSPAALQLAEWQRERLGPTRLLLCEVARSGPGSPGSGLLAWLMSLLNAPPAAVTAAGSDAAGLTTLTLEAADGRALQLTRWHAPGARGGLRLHLVGEQGRAVLDGPRRLSWADDAGTHARTLPRGRPVEQLLLRAFHEVVAEGRAPWPGLADAHRALVCLRAAAQSRHEGRRVEL